MPLLVTEAPVEIPYGTEDVHAAITLEVLAIAEGALGMVQLEVADKLVYHQEARQLLDVNEFANVLSLIERLHEVVETATNHVQRQGCCPLVELRFLDVDGQVIRL